MNGILVNNLTKRYGKTTALQNVSVHFLPERIYGLLGRNGAGKTTLLNTISNRIFADEGSVVIDGMPAQENDSAQNRVYMTGERTLYPETMRVSDAFLWTGAFYGDFDQGLAGVLCERFGLNAKKKIRALSTGYGSIFKMIAALCVDVPYVLLDEPVLGLDANHRELFYQTLLESYAARPRTFVISTHLIEEAAAVIEDVVIIKNGTILRDQPVDQLLSSGYTVSGMAAAVEGYCAGREVLSSESLGSLKTACILGVPDREQLPEGVEISALDLQKLFIRLTNE